MILLISSDISSLANMWEAVEIFLFLLLIKSSIDQEQYVAVGEVAVKGRLRPVVIMR